MNFLNFRIRKNYKQYKITNKIITIMSRAHMLYDDSAMSALPVKITRWNGAWNPDLIFKRRYVKFHYK